MLSEKVFSFAKKIGMSSYFSNGSRFPVTLLEIHDSVIVNIKTTSEDGYNALVLAAVDCKESKLSNPLLGQFKSWGVQPKRRIKEVRVPESSSFSKGDVFDVNSYSSDKYIDAIAYSKGHGFAGAMKRHNFRGLEATHGVSISHRSHGSTGQCQDPGRVFKGKKMAGHMGAKRVTKENLRVLAVYPDDNIVLVKGSVPGPKSSFLFLRSSLKKSF